MKVRRIGLTLITAAVIVGCDNGAFNSATKSLDNKPTGNCASNRYISNEFIVAWKDGTYSLEKSESVSHFKENFVRKNLSKLKHVEFNQEIKLHQDATDLVKGHAVDNLWGQQMIEAQAVWDLNVKGQGVLVGVVDAAIDYTHPQLKGQLARNEVEFTGRPGVDDDGNGFVDDYYGWDFAQGTNDPQNIVSSTNAHGTHVSGIIAADHTNGVMRGVAPLAKIVPANFMSGDSGSLNDAINALNYVSSRGVRVVNASWGGPICSIALKDVISNLASKNILFVAASGNDYLDLDTSPDFPANFNLANQINVAASRASDFLTTWSNTSFTLVHIGAPGEYIVSTVPGGYAEMSGTSMAAPFVTGAAAVLWSRKPTANYAQIKAALLASVDPRNFRVSSRGRLNLKKALSEIDRIVP